MLLMGVALTLIVGFPALADSWPTALRWTVGGLRWVLLAALLIGALAVLYRFAPDRDEPKWTWVSWGSGIATLLWILASIGARRLGSHRRRRQGSSGREAACGHERRHDP